MESIVDLRATIADEPPEESETNVGEEKKSPLDFVSDTNCYFL